MTLTELYAALDIKREIERKEGALATLRETGGVRAVSFSIPATGGNFNFPGQMAADLEKEIENLVSKLNVEKEIIRRGLSKIPLENTESRVMELRYVHCWGIEDIQLRLGYSRRRVYDFIRSSKMKIKS